MPAGKSHSERLSRRQFMQTSLGTALALGSSGAAIPTSAAFPDECLSEVARDQDTSADILSRYQRARILEQGSQSGKLALNTTLYPNWIQNSDSFWYVRDTHAGKQYRLVTAGEGKNRSAFDHSALAAALEGASGTPVDAGNLPLADMEIELSPRRVSFNAFERRWRYDAEAGQCQELRTWPNHWKLSPDGRYALFERDHNLWLYSIDSGVERPLTEDGNRFYAWGGTSTAQGRIHWSSLEALWSPDSQRVLTVVRDTREVKAGPPIVEHVPGDGSLRPRLIDPEYRKAFPGEENIEKYHLVAIKVDNGEQQFADYPATPISYPDYTGFFSGRRGWWSADSRTAYYLHWQADGTAALLLAFDTHSGSVRVVIEEPIKGNFNLIPDTHLSTLMVPLPESNELIWYSERSGWAHLYLYDLGSGKLKSPVTSGPWTVRNVLRYDPDRRELYLQSVGRVTGRNPYYGDICRVNIDTGQLTTVVSSDHDYTALDQRSRISFRDNNAQAVSPGGDYVVTTRSRVDQAPVTQLYDRDGNKLMDVEAADLSALPEFWRWPEPVMLKAADGKTDIYAVVYKPSDFSPDKSYPILDRTEHDKTPVGSFSNNTAGNWLYMSPAAYAELGFIVVMVAGRGTPLRGREFASAAVELWPANRQEDSVAAITQLAQRYSYMDLQRVGVGSWMAPSALRGMFRHPQFYRVGVTGIAAGDMRNFGAFANIHEPGPYIEEDAANLRGKLLIIAGMLNEVFHVSAAFRIVEALQQANKTFDMLMLPGEDLDLPGYATRREWDYWVENLLGEKPPEDFVF